LITESWLSNENHRIRDYQIKESFKRVEGKLENKSRIDAMFSGTTCVMCFFNHDMVVCANSGDSRAILVSEQEDSNGKGTGQFYFTQLSRDHKPELADEAARIFKKNGRIEPSRVTPDMIPGYQRNKFS
jgi:serine/threonine protein phosphatase PrpC